MEDVKKAACLECGLELGKGNAKGLCKKCYTRTYMKALYARARQVSVIQGKGVVVNSPPENGRCECCGAATELAKHFRDEGGGITGASWECVDCFALPQAEYEAKKARVVGP